MLRLILAPAAALLLAGCQSSGSESTGTGGSGGGLSGLVNVNLEEIRAEIAKNVNLDLDSVPITIQIPITIAANVCGTNVNVLTVQVNAGDNQCTAKASTAELEQEVINQGV